MISNHDIILIVNATAGVGLAVVLGFLASRVRPSLAHAGAWALVALLSVYALIVLFGGAIEPYPALLPLAFVSTAWAAAPLHAGVERRSRLVAVGVGLTGAIAVFLGSMFDLWWTLPILALAGGFLAALWQGRPDSLRRRDAKGEKELP